MLRRNSSIGRSRGCKRNKKAHPDRNAIGNLLAFTAMRAGNYDVAIQAYRKLLELAPEHATIYLSLGQAYFAKQDFTQAIQALEQTKRLGTKDGRAGMLLAAALGQIGRGKESPLRECAEAPAR